MRLGSLARSDGTASGPPVRAYGVRNVAAAAGGEAVDVRTFLSLGCRINPNRLSRNKPCEGEKNPVATKGAGARLDGVAAVRPALDARPERSGAVAGLARGRP